ncbi:MAG: hypothetical protein K0U74_17580 [Alphaproteobacteria bacterium]|nr:hypothetical protein [Alphaproteobacteria bacterium]
MSTDIAVTPLRQRMIADMARCVCENKNGLGGSADLKDGPTTSKEFCSAQQACVPRPFVLKILATS